MTNESEKIEQVFERCTSTDFSSRDREEILKAMQEYSDLQVKEERERIKELESYVNVKHAIDTINEKKKLIEELSEWKRSSMEVHKPLYDYMQGPAGEALGLRIGDSIIEKTVELLKEFLGKKLSDKI